ncbi:hypothetical protein SEA_ZOOMAN_178 [Microbacterium phage Zooman]|nr:hypothetical protein SEA_ZOOMAN_178 [Microbacterium phage Zooman]
MTEPAVHHPIDAAWDDETEKYGPGWITEEVRQKAIELELSRQNLGYISNGTFPETVEGFLENVEKIAQYIANGPSVSDPAHESIDL